MGKEPGERGKRGRRKKEEMKRSLCLLSVLLHDFWATSEFLRINFWDSVQSFFPERSGTQLCSFFMMSEEHHGEKKKHWQPAVGREEEGLSIGSRLCLCLRSAYHPFISFQGEIHRVKTDGSNRTVFAPLSLLGSSLCLALDWVSKNIYYTTPASRSIEVMLLLLCRYQLCC